MLSLHFTTRYHTASSSVLLISVRAAVLALYTYFLSTYLLNSSSDPFACGPPHLNILAKLLKIALSYSTAMSCILDTFTPPAMGEHGVSSMPQMLMLNFHLSRSPHDRSSWQYGSSLRYEITPQRFNLSRVLSDQEPVPLSALLVLILDKFFMILTRLKHLRW
jgi:hypothetical protein